MSLPRKRTWLDWCAQCFTAMQAVVSTHECSLQLIGVACSAL